jgi:hypothetical protein
MARCPHSSGMYEVRTFAQVISWVVKGMIAEIVREPEELIPLARAGVPPTGRARRL